jgi:hypothetical protein
MRALVPTAPMTIKLLCSEQVVEECLLPITIIETKPEFNDCKIVYFICNTTMYAI